jgi:hypothetical protein
VVGLCDGLVFFHERPERCPQSHDAVHDDVRAKDVDLKRLGAMLAVAHEEDLRDFASLLLVEGLGPRTLQSLALIVEVVHGAPSRFSDPARSSYHRLEIIKVVKIVCFRGFVVITGGLLYAEEDHTRRDAYWFF